jgi:AraC family transcriptional regulator
LRHENTQRTWSTKTVSVDEHPVSRLSLSSNTSPRSTDSEPAQVGHLVRRAMSLFETNRATAWRCLSDASSLLGTESHETSTLQSLASITLKPGGLSVWQVKRALAYIEANLGSKIGITEISASVALSKSHFCRAFKQTLGTSPMAYVSAQRIERAKILITSTSERLSDIALACGFADQSHLNRSFGRMVGMSPGVWRWNLSTPRSEPRSRRSRKSTVLPCLSTARYR